MFRYKLRTLLIVLAVGPPVLSGFWLLGNEARSRFFSRERVRAGSTMRCGRVDVATPPITEQDRLAWEEAKAVSRSLGAPQPVPLPEGY
jgi:hypothetical protein